MKTTLFIIGVIWLFLWEILRVYFIMPFPGSQQMNSVHWAYWIGRNILWLRLIGLVLVCYPIVYFFIQKQLLPKILAAVLGIAYIVVFYLFNYQYEADKMFYQPKHQLFANSADDSTNTRQLVIGVVINQEAKAYPLQMIGYHHQIVDTIGNTPVIITYCTVCRTGRVYSSFVNGKNESFRLVGMDHFNAMFEDATTKSWWGQATGEAIAGALQGHKLKELPSNQLTLAAWLRQYPNSFILQPDPSFKKQYADLNGYDKGTVKSSLEKRDSGSWHPKSWVVGVVQNGTAKAYDWNTFVHQQIINDICNNQPVVLVLEEDTASFHVFNRILNGHVFHFQKNVNNTFMDSITHSVWNMDGECIEGSEKGSKLQPVQAYQEFWHSWKTFHPGTGRYEE